ELWSCGVVELWSCGVVELWSCGVVELWSCGVAELRSCGGASSARRAGPPRARARCSAVETLWVRERRGGQWPACRHEAHMHVPVGGMPQPAPIWFWWDEAGSNFLIYNQTQAKRLELVRNNPQVALNFDGYGTGYGIIVFTGHAEICPDEPPADQHPLYLA